MKLLKATLYRVKVLWSTDIVEDWMKRPLLCMDFDGVIHSYTSGWQGAYTIPDPPMPGAMMFMFHVLNDLAWDVAIHSSRARYLGGITAMRHWLRRHAGNLWWEDGLGGRGLEDIQWWRTKPPAVLTIDDRAMQYNGTFPTLEAISKFKPWKPGDPCPTAVFSTMK